MLAPPRLARARARARERVVQARGRAEALPFPDGSFDVVTRALRAPLRRRRAATREAARVLRPGGQYILVDSYSPEDPVQDTSPERDRSPARPVARAQLQPVAVVRDVPLTPGSAPRSAGAGRRGWASRAGSSGWARAAPLVSRPARADRRGAAPRCAPRLGDRARDRVCDWSILIALRRRERARILAA